MRRKMWLFPLRWVNYHMHYQVPAAGFRCPFGFRQRLVILWPVPSETVRALVGKRWLALFQLVQAVAEIGQEFHHGPG